MRQLKRLHRTGGIAKVVAEHAEAIIQQWVSGNVRSPRQLTRSTRYGDARIKDCWKYDLVEAYRLLTVMAEDQFFAVPTPYYACNEYTSAYNKCERTTRISR